MRPDLHDEHGGIAVLTALLLVVLLGFGAVVVDVGALYVERRQLQNGADAAALAIAQRCAGGACGDVAGLAQQLADANAADGRAGIERLEVAAGRVTVGLRTRTADGAGALAHRLAPLLGVHESTVHARSGAGWGGPISGPAILPLALSWCSFAAQTGGGLPSTTTEATIRYLSQADQNCTSPSGHTIPGGFGWLQTTDSCSATVTAASAQTPGKTGVSVPDGCSPEDFQRLRGTTVLLPLFSEAGGTGNSGWFRIHGFAAFQITGYRFACPSGYRWNDGGSACGSSTERFVKGYFTQFVSAADGFTLGGPDLGGRVVALTH